MPTIYGTLMTSILESPPSDGAKLDAAQVGPKARAFVETITLESGLTAGSLLYCARVPANSRLLKVEITSSVSLTTATLAVTDGTTTFATAKAYGTATDETKIYIDATKVGTELTAETDLYLLTATATLPTSGTVKVVTYYADLN